MSPMKLLVAAAVGLSVATASAAAPMAVVRGTDVAPLDVALWSEAGKAMAARGPAAANAPKGAARLTAKITKMGGLTVRDIVIPKGSDFASTPSGAVSVIVSGRLKISDGSQEAVVEPGDTYSGASRFVALDDVRLIEVSAP